jgi:NADH dehydrogenase
MNIVVVGGGFGGVKTALELSNKPSVHVTLLVANNNFEYHGALYRTATGRSPLEVIIPLRDIFKQSKNVEIILDKMSSINAQKQYITSETGNTYRYDKAVLSLGNVVNYFGIEGMENNSFAINMITSNIALRHALVKLFKTHKHPKIVIVGAGPSGVELAGELQNFASMVSERYGKTAARVDAVLIEGTDKVLPLMGERVAKIALKRLQSLGVEVMLNTRVNMCQPGKICLESRDLSADIIVWTAGSKPVDIYASQPEVFKLDRGRVVVDDYLRASGREAIYVIGDNASTKYTGMCLQRKKG